MRLTKRLRGGPLCAGLALVALGAVGQKAHGQDVSARAYLSSNQIGEGRQFVLNVEVSGTQQLDADPELPDMESFARYLGSGTSTSMQTVNGRMSLAVTVQYRFQALAQGTHRIGPVRVHAGGRTLQTEPMTVVVSDAPPAQSGPASDGGVTPEDLFIETRVSKTTALENEPVLVEYRIFTRVNVESYTITALPTATGFWTEELEQPQNPRVEQVVRDGQQYATAVVRRVALFPTGVGQKTLDRLSLEAQVRVRNRRSLLDPFDSFFDRSSLLGARVPVVVTSEPVTIDVAPLPREGRPESFRGHVGSLDVATSVDRRDAEANEAFTFRVDVSGTGNLRSLPPPEIEFPVELEVFPPEVSEVISEGGGSLRGTRSFEYVVIPRVAGPLTLPPVEVSYFDVASASYRTASSDPLELAVTGGAAVTSGEGGAVAAAVEPIREEIRFIHIGAPRFVPVERSPFSSPTFWVLALAPLFLVAGAVGLRRHRDRLEGDVAYARVRRAARMAKRRLKRARQLASGEPRDFYGEVAGALNGFVADKLNVSEAGLVRPEITELARKRGASAETLQRLVDCLDDCDRQRFAPPGTEMEPADRVLARVAGLMSDLDKELSR